LKRETGSPDYPVPGCEQENIRRSLYYNLIERIISIVGTYYYYRYEFKEKSKE